MSAVNKVDVVIGGEIITLVSGEHEDYMQTLARYIDRKLSEIKSLNSTASINERTRTLFIAINVADDYFKTLERLRRLEAEHSKYIAEMGRMQEENYLLTEKLHHMQDQYNQSRAELDAYIESFEQNDAAAQDDKKKVVNIKPRVANGHR